MGLNTSAIKDRNMVFPSRLTDPDLGLRKVFVQEVCTHFECTRTTQSLNGDDTPLLTSRASLTENEFLCSLIKALEPIHRQIDSDFVIVRN